MKQAQTCTFTNQYSEIDGFQESRTVTYSAEAIPDGVQLIVKQESAAGLLTEACVCPSESFENTVSFLKYICENSIGIGSWYDILNDMDIQFTVV